MTEITCDILVCVVGVWQRDFLDLWCVCAWCDESHQALSREYHDKYAVNMADI